MLLEIVAVCLPFIVGIVLVGLGHDISDPVVHERNENA
jgi:hypothetical protein